MTVDAHRLARRLSAARKDGTIPYLRPDGKTQVTIEYDGDKAVRLDTVVLSTVATSKPREGIDFFPLTVDYREYTYSAGRFPGGFIKREGRPSEKEVLTSRLIDRPIRPLFPEGYLNETQIIAMVLSADPQLASSGRVTPPILTAPRNLTPPCAHSSIAWPDAGSRMRSSTSK